MAQRFLAALLRNPFNIIKIHNTMPCTQEWLLLSAHWKAINICHACMMTKFDFAQVPNPLKNLPRRDLRDFMTCATKPGEKSP